MGYRLTKQPDIEIFRSKSYPPNFIVWLPFICEICSGRHVRRQSYLSFTMCNPLLKYNSFNYELFFVRNVLLELFVVDETMLFYMQSRCWQNLFSWRLAAQGVIKTLYRVRRIYCSLALRIFCHIFVPFVVSRIPCSNKS